MSWHLDTIRIFVQEIETGVENIIARLQPLGGGTVLHKFGHDSLIVNVTAIVVGYVDLGALRDMTESSNSFTLYKDGTPLNDYFVHKVNSKIIPTICQTLRPDLSEDAEVYNVSLELYLDET